MAGVVPQPHAMVSCPVPCDNPKHSFLGVAWSVWDTCPDWTEAPGLPTATVIVFIAERAGYTTVCLRMERRPAP
jgi:hypothetical protein